MPRYVTVDEAAQYLLWHPRTIYRKVRELGIPYICLPIKTGRGGRPRNRVVMELDGYLKQYAFRRHKAKPPTSAYARVTF